MKHRKLSMLRHLCSAIVMAGAVFTSIPAQACQLVCMQTLAVYDGNLGGYSGADAKCAAEYPNFKFARSAALAGSLAGFYNGLNAWAPEKGYDCTGWTSNSSGVTGKYLAYAASGYTTGVYSSAIQACNVSRYILCCNM